jgi:hypothetical protein
MKRVLVALLLVCGNSKSHIFAASDIVTEFVRTRPAIRTLLVRYEVQIDQDMETFKELEEENPGFGQGRLAPIETRASCVWAQDGDKEYYERIAHYPEGWQNWEKAFFDGSKTQWWHSKVNPKGHDRVSINGPKDAAFPNTYRYPEFCVAVDGQGLQDFLSAANVTQDEPDAVGALRLRIESAADPTTYTLLWLDRQRSFAPQRLQRFTSGKIWREWQVNSFKKVSDALWLPDNVEQKTFLHSSGRLIAVYRITATEIRFNEALPDELFRPRFAQDVEFTDASAAATPARPRPSPVSATKPGDLHMEFHDVPAVDFYSILARMFKRTVVVQASAVAGTVSYGPQTTTLAEHLHAIDEALRSSGLRLIDIDQQHIKIVPASEKNSATQASRIELTVRDEFVLLDGKELSLPDLPAALEILDSSELEVWIYDPGHSKKMDFWKLRTQLQAAHLRKDRIFFTWSPPSEKAADQMGLKK